jgi:LPPG:FO 2-phospho-L-lactate transferase
VIANTADDDDFWGLRVCPDIDAVIYRLAGVFNDAVGYGVKDDTFHVLDALRAAGDEAWFRIGDHDFATHLLRTQMLARGASLTEASLELCARFGVRARVIPMSDEVVRTRFRTDRGEFSFQEYFVRERLKPRLHAIDFATPEPPHTTAQVTEAIRAAERVIIGPSNPLISIEPILQLTRQLIERERTIAITPLVGGVALKGPTVEMMRATTGADPTPVDIARRYVDVAQCFVLDERDASLRTEIEALGYKVLVRDTVMRDDGGRALARAVLGDL